MKKSLVLAIAVACMVIFGVANVQATMSWNWTETSVDPGVIVASGTFTTAGNALVPEEILNINGIRNGQTITGPVTPAGNNGSFQWDNLFSTSAPHFTNGGLLMNVAGGVGDTNIYSVGNQIYDFTYSGIPQGSNIGNGIPVNFTASAVPIPGAIWLLASGLLGLVGIRRKFKTA